MSFLDKKTNVKLYLTFSIGIFKVIPFLKVYIALTSPECTDSQSLLQDGNPN